MSRAKIIFRRVRTLLWTALTLITILAAVLVGVGKLLMPYSVRYKPQLEAWLSREFNQPVRVDDFTGEWKAFGPRITLEGLNLLGKQGGAGEIAIRQVALDIKPLNALIAGRPLYTFRIIGADLALVRDAEGRLELSGLGVSGRGGGEPNSGLRSLASVGEVRLEESSLSYDDDTAGMHLRLVGVNGALQLDGSNLAMEVQASVAGGQRERVLGDLGLTILVTLDDQEHLSDVRMHAEVGELMLSELGKLLPDQKLRPESGWLNGEVWGTWSRGEAQRMEGVLDLREASFDTADAPLQLEHLNTRFRWRFSNRYQWRLDLADLQVEETGRKWNSPRLSVERNIPGGLGVWVSADYVEPEFPLRVTHEFMDRFHARWPRSVPRQGRGQIRNFDLVIDSNRKLAGAWASFENLDAWDWGPFPALYGVAGRADMAFGDGTITFSGHQARVEWPRNFTAPAVVDIPACRVDIGWGDSWQVDIRDCSLDNESIGVHGRARIAGNEGKPAVDLNFAVDHARLDGLDDYWPRSVMKPSVTDWLGRALKAGDVASGRFILQGDLDDWPFRGGEGTLEARVEAHGAEIDYQPGWPAAKGVDAVAEFQGVGMRISGSIADLGGAPVEQVTARIDDLQAARLDLSYETSAPLAGLVSFIGKTPLLEGSRLDLGRFAFSGAAHTRGRLQVPLRAAETGLTVDGELQLADNSFTDLPSKVRLENLRGTVSYDRAGFRGSGLQALWDGYPSQLELAADWAADELFKAKLQGRYPAAVLIGESPLRDDPLLASADGDSDWDITLSVARAQGDAPNDIWLTLSSKLQGVSLDAPDPLHKPPAAAWPLSLKYPIQAAQPVLTAKLADRVSVAVDLPGADTGPRSAAIHFGAGRTALPPAGRFDIGGSVKRLNLDGWIDAVARYFQPGHRAGALTLRHIDLRAGELQFLNRGFANVGLQADYDDPILKLTFEGGEIAGTVRYNRAEGGVQSLAAEMDRLTLGDPLSGGMTMQTDPALLPEMHLYVRDFNYLGVDLGETRIEAYPVDNGLHIESVQSVSPRMNFQARGDWTRSDSGTRSDFNIVLTSESLGTLINAFKLSSVLEGGQTMIRYDAWWPGPPAAFALAILNGKMTFNVVDGKILNADPGAGRVLGLISLTELPRRLALDFRDVFESGFSFDQATGTIQLENGNAYTNDFTLESTAATLSIEGSSDLVNQQFDYQMVVRPGVSQALPVIGALAAGPGGAAAGLALQGLLKQALGDATEARYEIKGPWSEPLVTRLPARSQEESAPANQEASPEPDTKDDTSGQ